MFDIPLRRFKDKIFDPISRLIPRNITPNMITLLAFVTGLGSCYAAVFCPIKAYALILWLLNRALDCLDGSIARVRGTSTDLGGFLDLLSDFVIYSLLPISVAHGQDRQGSHPDWRSVAVLEATFHINNFILFYIAAVATKKGEQELTSVSMRPALVEGFEAAVFFTAMISWPEFIAALSWVMSAAVCVGILQRVAILVPILRRGDARQSLKDV